MAKKQKKEKKMDEHALGFAVKIVVSVVSVFLFALGMDIYHAVQAIGKLYGGSV